MGEAFADSTPELTDKQRSQAARATDALFGMEAVQ
jgi:hypothetical protein